MGQMPATLESAMRVKTFEAASMQEALVTIKQEMGEDAYILSTKTRRPSKPGGAAVIEVTAAIDDSGAPPIGEAQGPRPGGTYGLRQPLSQGAKAPDAGANGAKGINGSNGSNGPNGHRAAGAAPPGRRAIEALDVPAAETIRRAQPARPAWEADTSNRAGDASGARSDASGASGARSDASGARSGAQGPSVAPGASGARATAPDASGARSGAQGPSAAPGAWVAPHGAPDASGARSGAQGPSAAPGAWVAPHGAPDASGARPAASDEPTMDLQPIRQELLEIRGAVEALKGQDGRNGAVLAELDQLKGMLSRLQKHGLPALPHQLPPALLKLYGDLAANDVDPMIAVRLCEYTQRALAEQGGEEDFDHDKARLYMRRVISDFIPVATPIQADPSRAQAAALVGPAGAGKTATIAKLAALAKADPQRVVALLSLDVFRAGAADRLQRHASELRLPMHVCITAEDLRNALNYYRDGALVLIDTPGLRQGDAAGMEKLASLLDEARLAETHLVLSATSKPRDLAETAARFERLRPTRLLFTKLDETCTHGPILSTLVRVKKPLSYLGVGQDVPRDLEPATSRRVADLILPPAQARP